MKPRFKLLFLCLVIVSTTFLTTAFSANRVHRTGNVWINLTDYGYLGNKRQMDDPETPGRWAPECEFPGGSGSQYLRQGGLWIGALIRSEDYEEPFVSIAVDGWVHGGQTEFFASDDAEIIERSDVEGATDYLGNDIYDPEASATQEFLCEYSDTLGIKVNQKSVVWDTDDYADLVIIQYDIANEGEYNLKNMYVGHYIDADVGMSDERMRFLDDLNGFQKWFYFENENGELDSTEINLAYAVDNDGRPNDVGAGTNFTAPGVSGIMLLDSPNTSIHTSFNWWISSGDEDYDFGPSWTDDGAEDDWTQLWGSPDGDLRRYFLMSNREIDYDMCLMDSPDYLRDHPQEFRDPNNPEDIIESHEWRIPGEDDGTPDDFIEDYANGNEAEYLISWGPVGIFDHIDESGNRIYRLDPGESFTMTVAYVCADGFHDRHRPQPTNEVIDRNLFNFTPIRENARRAQEVYERCLLSVDSKPSVLMPKSVFLLTSYPSPFNSAAMVTCNAPVPGNAAFSITDISGRLVRQWVEPIPVAGEMNFRINGTGLSTGTYWLNIEQQGRVGSTRLVLVK